MLTHYTIYGERNSGTKILQKILSECFSLKLTWHYGWKHFFGHKTDQIKQSQETLFFGIVRNPYNWINSMVKRPYHVPVENIPLHNFLFKEWYSIYDEKSHGDMIGREIMEDRCWLDNSRYKNIFHMRKCKLLFLKENMPQLTSNYYLVRYEDLCKDTDAILDEISNRFTIKRRDYITPIEINNQHISKNLEKIISKNTDWKTESNFNYTERVAHA